MGRLRYGTCSRSGCGELVLIGEGPYCRDHRPPAWNGRTGRSRAASSGLSGWKAQAAAREVLARCPVCYACREAPSTEADHTVPLAWSGNGGGEMLGICTPCHRRKTTDERAIGRRYGGRPPDHIVREHVERWLRNGGRTIA